MNNDATIREAMQAIKRMLDVLPDDEQRGKIRKIYDELQEQVLKRIPDHVMLNSADATRVRLQMEFSWTKGETNHDGRHLTFKNCAFAVTVSVHNNCVGPWDAVIKLNLWTGGQKQLIEEWGEVETTLSSNDKAAHFNHLQFQMLSHHKGGPVELTATLWCNNSVIAYQVSNPITVQCKRNSRNKRSKMLSRELSVENLIGVGPKLTARLLDIPSMIGSIGELADHAQVLEELIPRKKARKIIDQAKKISAMSQAVTFNEERDKPIGREAESLSTPSMHDNTATEFELDSCNEWTFENQSWK